MDSPQEAKDGEGKSCCAKASCCCKAAAAVALLLVGGAVGFFAGRCGKGMMCPTTPSMSAPAQPK